MYVWLASSAIRVLLCYLQGTGNVINIGMQSYGLWMQSMIDDISNDDNIGVISVEQSPRKRFGRLLL